jgi:predicted transcriptional regulator
VPSVVILDKQGRERFRHLGLMTDVELGEVLDRF